jgi:nicotinate-nucleotide adenylyltransferase
MDVSGSIGRRVAFFGGSFDPPHEGHLAVARAARDALALDTVLFVPVGAQPLKPEGSNASFEDRLAMTGLAVAGEAGLSVSQLDAPRPLAAPNYTFDSLVRLRAEIPADGSLFCLLGADSFLSLRQWHRAAEIPFLAALVVASRPGLPLDDMHAALPRGLTLSASTIRHGLACKSIDLRSYVVNGPDRETAPLYVLPGLQVEISASEIREAVRGAIGAADLSSGAELPQLSPAVLEYIRRHRLYR